MRMLDLPLKTKALPYSPFAKLILFNIPLLRPVLSLAFPSPRHHATTPCGLLGDLKCKMLAMRMTKITTPAIATISNRILDLSLGPAVGIGLSGFGGGL